jgi:hypothetical protein
LPSAGEKTLGKTATLGKELFAECQALGKLRHSAKRQFAECQLAALGKDVIFAECFGLALGKIIFFLLFWTSYFFWLVPTTFGAPYSILVFFLVYLLCLDT